MIPKLWSSNFILLVIANAFSRCSFDILLPTLPIFLVANGSSSSHVGVIMGIFTFSAIFIRFFSAKGSRRLGIKRFLYLGLIICTLSSAAYSIGTTFATAASIRIFHGLGFGIATTLTATIAASVIPASRRGEGFGFLGFGALITAAIAPFLGLWLLNQFGSTCLFLFTALTQLGVLIFMIYVSVPEEPSVPLDKPEKHSVLDRLVEKTVLFPALLTLLMGICLSSVMCFIALFGKEIHVSNVGWFFLASTLGAFVARLFSGRIYDRHGRSWVIIPGLLFTLAGLIFIAQSTTLYHLIIAASFYGLGSGAVFPSMQAWIITRAAPDRHNEANAMFYNAFDIGIGGGSILLGLIAAATSYAAMYLSAAAVMGTLLTIYVVSELLQQKNRQRTPEVGNQQPALSPNHYDK